VLDSRIKVCYLDPSTKKINSRDGGLRMATNTLEFPLSAREHAEKIWNEDLDTIKKFLEEVGKALQSKFIHFDGEFRVVWEQIEERISFHACTLIFVERRPMRLWGLIPFHKKIAHRVVEVELPFWSRHFGPEATKVSCHVSEIVEDVRQVRDVLVAQNPSLPQLSIL